MKRFLFRLRRFFSVEYHLSRRTKRRTGAVVQAGPFRGMRYISHAYGSVYLPKLLGIYEREVYPHLERAISGGHDRLVNVGVAEGYFAVGLATKQDAPIIGFESDPEAANAARQLADLNGVARRVQIEGDCSPHVLQKTLDTAESPFLFCDVDGYEQQLLDADLAPALKRTTMLIELHEFACPGITDELYRRFRETHAIELVHQKQRTGRDYPYRSGWVRWIPERLLHSQVDEMRPHEQSWLWLHPKQANTQAA